MPSSPESALLCDLAFFYIPSRCQLLLYFYPTYLQLPGLKRSLCYCFLANTLFNGKRLSNACCQVHPGLYGTKYLFLPLHKQPQAVFRPAAWERAGFDRLGPVLRGQVPPHGAGAALCSCRRRRSITACRQSPDTGSSDTWERWARLGGRNT